MEHVTEVSVGCPAYECGLQPYSDYIFATDNGDVSYSHHHHQIAHRSRSSVSIYIEC